jgi:acyl-coenzyme A thioesterase PaaI-like protein
MDATAFAGELLGAVPANVTLGLQVVRAVDGFGEVEMQVRPEFGNVIGSLHASGLIGLVDGACLAAVISAAEEPAQLDGVVPLGSHSELQFHAPARGVLRGRCQLSAADMQTLTAFYTAPPAAGITLTTTADVADRDAVVVCRGSFTWSIRRGAGWP